MEDLYSFFGIPRDADAKTIKRAYHRKAMEFHPDKIQNPTEDNSSQFQRIIDAYMVLSNDSTRKDYDASLVEMEEESKRVGSMSKSRRNMIEDLENREKIAKGLVTDPLKPFRDDLESAIAGIKTDSSSLSFIQYEKVILQTLLNM